MDQFRQLQHGDQLDGLPRQPWNRLLDTLKNGFGGEPRANGAGTSVEFPVANTTNQTIKQFGILGIKEPLTLYSQDQHGFLNSDAMKGTAPTAIDSFVVLQDGANQNDVVRARVLGLTRVRVLLEDPTHLFAGPTTSTDHLTSGATGPAQIVWVEPASGWQGSGSGSGSGGGSGPSVWWAVVILGGGGSAGAGTRVEVGEPHNSGVTPPDPLLMDFRVMYGRVNPVGLDAGELVWAFDANAVP